jgi:hypothetical protein
MIKNGGNELAFSHGGGPFRFIVSRTYGRRGTNVGTGNSVANEAMGVTIGHDMDNETKNRLADRVQVATAEALQAMVCPTCGGSLDVQFAPKGKKGKGAGALSVMCGQCMWRVVSDGVLSAPPWVPVLGSKFQTNASSVAKKKKRTKPTVTA